MKLLIVDDSKTDVMMLCSMLKDFELTIAFDGVEAMEAIEKDPEIDIMVLDINMPRMNGFEVLEEMRKHPENENISTIILTNYNEIDDEIRGLDLGAVDYIRKPLNLRSLRKRIDLHSNLKSARKALERHNLDLEKTIKERTEEARLSRDVAINALVSLLEVRNIESSNHTKRTQWMMRLLCEHLCVQGRYQSVMTDAYINELFSTSPLHDIGKVGIPDAILLKPGKLTVEEFEIMKKHTTFGVDALIHAGRDSSNLSFIRTALEIVGTHHEKFDGSGYPAGLVGKEIPLAGRLMAIVDVYDALVSERVYKPAFSHEIALDIIIKDRNKQFDPEIVDAFVEIEKDIRNIEGWFVQQLA